MTKKVKYKTVKKLPERKYPLQDKRYGAANELANEEEKKKYGDKKFKRTLKVDRKLPKGQVAGHFNRKGKIYVSKKVPKDLREEVAYHDEVEKEYFNKRKK